ncbi:MAG: WbqC family protein [Prevotella sp.]|nr:WbqC family protein [Prevotella sp.]
MTSSGVFPYLGSSGWYRRWFGSSTFPQPQGHDLVRTLLSADTTLSLPVQGGFRRLRHTLSEQSLCALTLSDHAAWPANHLGAIKALYGKAPYFDHYFPALQRIYGSVSAGQPLHLFTLALHNVFFHNLPLRAFFIKSQSQPLLFAALRSERLPQAPDELSVLHAFMNLGPETPFTLIPQPFIES